MAELSQADLVYSPRSVQLWNVLVNWLDFFYRFFLKILRVDAHHHSLLSTSPSTKDGFKPLSVLDLPKSETESPVSIEIASERTSTDGQVSTIQKLTVVLDLDETLVSAYETSSIPTALRTQAIEAGLKWFELECVSSTKECNGKPKTSHVTVFERPGLHEFLEQLSQFAHLILFTAALEDYARPIVDRIDTKRVLNHRLYRPSTISTQYRDHVKDLLCVSKNMCRTVIVDNNPYCFLLQPLNGIPCESFSAEQPNDTQLLDVVLPLLKQLSEEEDVRLALYDRFHMPEWFEKQGIPRSCWTSSSQILNFIC
ncbi:PREDICTED: CTD nuclear envelope phosphatase 1 homolog isoform X1 [Camelina sativa]|uniref:CTD nuclear envelope phosphatase 1 homolog isoform X1 n=1 Tax=Camelina sativa TaxID=90675 RepID=A0ABM0ZLH6_CAMSA|nr:PREDICTED: CTD nuclear envelope phosphatase 1 homolog isoform X1 [Camelina sativa]